MNVLYACHHCGFATRAELDDPTLVARCRHCDHEVSLPRGAVVDGRLRRCVVCPSDELYVRKDFPQRLGVTIVVIGLAISCIPWYHHNWFGTFAVLFATALFDALLYAVKGNLLQCYRCHAQYRDVAGIDDHEPFDLEVHERHRQHVARLKEFEKKAAGQREADVSPPITS